MPASRRGIFSELERGRVFQHPVQLLDRPVGGFLALEPKLDIHFRIVRMPYPHIGRSALKGLRNALKARRHSVPRRWRQFNAPIGPM